MIVRFLLLFFTLTEGLVTAQQSVVPSIPELVFPYPDEAPGCRLTDNEVVRVVDSILSDERDSKLTALNAELKEQKRPTILQELGDPSSPEPWFDLHGCILFLGRLKGRHPSFSRLVLDNARLLEVNFDEAEFGSGLLRGARLYGAKLAGANFSGARLRDARFEVQDMARVNFRGAKFGGSVEFMNCKLNGSRFDQSIDLDTAKFTGGALRGVSFAGIVGERLLFFNVDLSEAMLDRASIRNSRFINTILNKTEFTEADLTGCTFASTRVEGPVRITRAQIGFNKFGDLELDKLEFISTVWGESNYFLKDELEAEAVKTQDRGPGALAEKIRLYEQAEVGYRALASKYAAISFSSEYFGLRYRAYECHRKKLLLDSTSSAQRLFMLGVLHASWLVDGYGTRPLRLIGWLVAIILLGSVVLHILRRYRWGTWQWRREGEKPILKPVAANASDTERNEDPLVVQPRSNPEDGDGEGWRDAVLVSLYGTFLATEKLFGIPDLFSILRDGKQPVFEAGHAPQTVFFALAFCGTVLLGLGARMVFLYAIR